MRKEGVEPTRPFGHRILSPARLPVPPLPHGDTLLIRKATRRFWCRDKGRFQPHCALSLDSSLRAASARLASDTMLYRSNTERVLCPLMAIAILSRTPLRIMFLTAERRRSWRTRTSQCF